MLKKVLLGSAAALFAIGIAVGQQWLNFPIVGQSSFCSSTVNGTCVNTVPAGPALTGNETIPADTNLSDGSSPQTVKIPVVALNSGPYQYNAPLTGASLTVGAKERQLIIQPAGTIAALTVTTPAASLLQDGQRWGLCTTQIVTALTLTAGSGTTILNGPTALLVPVATGEASCVEFLYRQANTTWYRVQ